MKEVLKISIPAMLDSLVAVIITSIDTRMISVLGPEAISAVSFTTQPKMIVFAVFFALGAATSIFVAQAYGREDAEEANACFHTILRVTVLLSVSLGILTGVLARPIMHLCNHQADTVEMSVTFFRIIMVCMIFHSVSVIINSALRGIGKTKVTFFSSIAMGAVDIVMNYLLIEGRLGFPRLEVAGDAIATVCGTFAACVFSICYLKRSDGFLHLKGRNDTCSNRTSVKRGSLIGISLSNGADDVSYALSYEDFPFFDIVQIYLIDADSGANKMKEVGQEF